MKKILLAYTTFLAIVSLVILTGCSRSQGEKESTPQARPDGFRPLMGEITAHAGDRLTLKLGDDSNQEIILTQSTQISKMVVTSKSDLAVGEKVSAMGTANADGSLTANFIHFGSQAPQFFQARFGRPDNNAGDTPAGPPPNFKERRQSWEGRGENDDRPSGNNNRPNNRPSGMERAIGEIIEMDDQSMTLKLEDGGSRIVLFSETTQFVKTLEASPDDLSVGQRISARTEDNEQGKFSATNIEIILNQDQQSNN